MNLCIVMNLIITIQHIKKYSMENYEKYISDLKEKLSKK